MVCCDNFRSTTSDLHHRTRNIFIISHIVCRHSIVSVVLTVGYQISYAPSLKNIIIFYHKMVCSQIIGAYLNPRAGMKDHIGSSSKVHARSTRQEAQGSPDHFYRYYSDNSIATLFHS